MFLDFYIFSYSVFWINCLLPPLALINCCEPFGIVLLSAFFKNSCLANPPFLKSMLQICTLQLQKIGTLELSWLQRHSAEQLTCP